MKALIFSGALERKEDSISENLIAYVRELLENKGIETNVFKIVDSGIPLFDPTYLDRVPLAVQRMAMLFRDADIHIWLTPLYHGSMTGVMKNCLDWLEISSDETIPYLTGKVVGLVCWADGIQALHGIDAMDRVARSLRAWTAPYNVSIQRSELFSEDGMMTENYRNRFNILLQLLTWKCP